MTAIEEQLDSIVRKLGFATEPEVEFKPYRVDIYAYELHVAFEADGPQHSKPRDERRDAELLETYGLIVFRVGHMRLRNSESRAAVAVEILGLVDQWAETSELRRDIAAQNQH